MDLAKMEWMDKHDRMPTAEDADPWDCVLVWHEYNGTQVLGWDNPMLRESRLITHWMTPPTKPKGVD